MKKRSSEQIFAETMMELAEHTPIDKITLRQIVQESGLSTKTFYNHFKDKYDLIVYIINAVTETLHSKLALGDYSFHDYILDAVAYYQNYRGFLQNAFEHTVGDDSIRKKHAEAAYQALAGYLLKRNKLDHLPENIILKLRLYAYGVDELFSYCYLYEDKIPPEAFVRECEECMPDALKAYFL